MHINVIKNAQIIYELCEFKLNSTTENLVNYALKTRLYKNSAKNSNDFLPRM